MVINLSQGATDEMGPSHEWMWTATYRQISNIRGTKSQVENEDIVGAAPTGDAPTTSEWSTIVLPTKMRLV